MKSPPSRPSTAWRAPSPVMSASCAAMLDMLVESDTSNLQRVRSLWPGLEPPGDRVPPEAASAGPFRPAQCGGKGNTSRGKLGKWLALAALRPSAMSPAGAQDCEVHLPVAHVQLGWVWQAQAGRDPSGADPRTPARCGGDPPAPCPVLRQVRGPPAFRARGLPAFRARAVGAARQMEPFGTLGTLRFAALACQPQSPLPCSLPVPQGTVARPPAARRGRPAGCCRRGAVGRGRAGSQPGHPWWPKPRRCG